VRAHLRDVVANAKRAVLPVGAPPAPSPDQVAQTRALSTLYAWYKDWSETAHALIHRRDYLVLMGLAKRRSRRSAGASRNATGDTAPDQPQATA
jgi:hypothetical protein